MMESDKVIFSNDYFDESEVNSLADAAFLEPGVYYPKHTSHHKRTSRSQNKRFVFKNGEFNIDKGLSNHQGFFSRWFVTMVEARWRWTLVHFFLAFTGDWLFFGLIYWMIALTHGDLTEDHLPHNQNSSNWTPCVENIYGFTSTFLFSVEVHTTVAYGKRSITLECPQTITAMCFQCIVCSFFQAFMIGILFAKLTRPKGRTQTILFSKRSVVTLRDGKLCMIFRVGDMRKSRILNIKSTVFVLKLGEDHNEDYEQRELEVEMDGCESTFFLWPVSVIHVIDEKSPFYNISAADLLVGKFEILAIFEGVIESTGQSVQARTSYTENDILWGHRFVNMVNSDNDKNVYDVDFSKLCETERVDTPLCSASEFKSMLSLFDLDTLI
ncbi:G protein-activated inward rectifier potassium channel 1-like isoform X2 [Trichoplusia ni]|uniref:G protein-activated inward rectifier potassium channel 1-like isoform X2 n=1 Tax=Trichoplusia ni TaxID=7111 RepID=A0A7E5VBN9_TRINI|nr:G protein-activated inward rectifier potassium channel 1-like isoform X2 [Trichoplusia ni]